MWVKMGPHHFLKFAQVCVHCIGDAIQPSHSLSPFLLLPSIFPSIRVFSNESALCITTSQPSSDTGAWEDLWPEVTKGICKGLGGDGQKSHLVSATC